MSHITRVGIKLTNADVKSPIIQSALDTLSKVTGKKLTAVNKKGTVNGHMGMGWQKTEVDVMFNDAQGHTLAGLSSAKDGYEISADEAHFYNAGKGGFKAQFMRAALDAKVDHYAKKSGFVQRGKAKTIGNTSVLVYEVN